MGRGDGRARFVINARIASTAKPATLKDPNGNITWVPPEAVATQYEAM